VQLHVKVGAPNHLRGDRPRNSLRLRAASRAWEHAVEVLAVEGIDEGDTVLECGHVGQTHQDDRPAQLARVDARQQALRREDWRKLIAVHSRRQGQHRSGRGAVEHGNGHDRCRVSRASRDREVDVHALPR
jgi:hypothetical protein